MAEGLILRVSHGGVNNTSVLLSDVEDGTNQPNTMPRPGGVYVPVGSFVDLVFTADLHILVARDGTLERHRPFTSAGF